MPEIFTEVRRLFILIINLIVVCVLGQLRSRTLHRSKPRTYPHQSDMCTIQITANSDASQRRKKLNPAAAHRGDTQMRHRERSLRGITGAQHRVRHHAMQSVGERLEVLWRNEQTMPTAIQDLGGRTGAIGRDRWAT